MRCKKSSDLKESIMKPIGKVIKNILYLLEVKCPNKDCEQIMTLEKYEEHEYYCHLPKCQNIMCGMGSEKLIYVKQYLTLSSINLKTMKSLNFVLKCVNLVLYFNV
jgi:hypothetical protein